MVNINLQRKPISIYGFPTSLVMYICTSCSYNFSGVQKMEQNIDMATDIVNYKCWLEKQRDKSGPVDKQNYPYIKVTVLCLQKIIF